MKQEHNYDAILAAVQYAQARMFNDPVPSPQWYETTHNVDPSPYTPILPADAPDGVPDIILIELPILEPIIVIKGDE